MNRLCEYFDGIGFVPVHNEPYEFLTDPPEKIGDAALIRVDGKREMVCLLKSSNMVKNSTYLVRLP